MLAVRLAQRVVDGLTKRDNVGGHRRVGLGLGELCVQLANASDYFWGRHPDSLPGTVGEGTLVDYFSTETLTGATHALSSAV